MITATPFFLSRLEGSAIQNTFSSYLSTSFTFSNFAFLAHATATSTKAGPLHYIFPYTLHIDLQNFCRQKPLLEATPQSSPSPSYLSSSRSAHSPTYPSHFLSFSSFSTAFFKPPQVHTSRPPSSPPQAFSDPQRCKLSWEDKQQWQWQ